MDPDLTRELLHSYHASQTQQDKHLVGVPDSGQPLKVLVKNIRQVPALLHREVSKPAQSENRKLVV